MNQLPEPLTPPDCDLTGMTWMPLDVGRVIDSDTFGISTGDEFKVAFRLWAKSWSQVPAASLPKDDRLIAHLAGLSENMAKWRKVKDVALRGFIECSDGRLYHPVIAQKALEAMDHREDYEDKQENRKSRQQMYRERRSDMFSLLKSHGFNLGWKTPNTELERLISSLPVTETVTPVTQTVTPVTPPQTAIERTVQDRTVNQNLVVALSVDPTHATPQTPHNATRQGEIAVLLRNLGAAGVTPTKLAMYPWINDPKATNEAVTAAWHIAREKQPAPARIDVAYVAAMMPDVLNPKPVKERKQFDDWHKTDGGTDKKARELGMTARGGETYQGFRDRIWAEIRKRQGVAA